MNEKQIAALEFVLENCEPKWKTHSLSCWNVIRRLVHKIKTGEQISEAFSWNEENKAWEL